MKDLNGLEISNAEYREMEGISSSDLKKLAISPMHYKYFKENPQEDTPALLFGKAYHKMVLEPSDFFTEFAIAQNFDRRTKEGKEAYAKFVEQNKGKDIIDQATYDKLVAMRDTLYATPYARKLIYGTHEKSFFWIDEETGLKCKCRPDSFGSIGGRHLIVDLKTTTNAETQAFVNQAIKLSYDIQAAHYCAGMKDITGNDYTFVFIAQEKEAPYCVNILEANSQFMRSGEDTRRALLETMKECMETGKWYGYMGADNEIASLGVPKWLEKAYPMDESEE